MSGHAELWPGVRVRGQLVSGLALPRPTVRFAERTVAWWGRPFVSVELLVHFAIPGT